MATLGEVWTETTPAALSQSSALKQSVRTTRSQSGLYATHEMQLENGTVVKELTDSEGRVFAVAWRGPVLPDFKALLGSHFDALSAGAKKARTPGKLGTPLSIEQERVVIRSSGRMRHFVGHAYAPDLVPSGVNLNEVLQ